MQSKLTYADLDVIPDAGGGQTYGSGAFATFWVAPMEYGTEYRPAAVLPGPAAVPDLDDPVFGRHYDTTEDVIDLDQYVLWVPPGGGCLGTPTRPRSRPG